jgi:hypothetical protein
MAKFKRNQSKYVKKPYKISNWAQYNFALMGRGSLSLLISDEVIQNWISKKTNFSGKQKKYSNSAIESASMVSAALNLPLRQTVGLFESFFSKLGLDLDVPHYSTLSRRRKKLKVKYHEFSSSRPIHVLIDSSGIKIHGGNRRKLTKDRDWRKIHFAVDAKTGEIVSAELTANAARDGSRVPKIISKIERPLASVCADAAYDSTEVYTAISEHSPERNTRILIPPKKNAVLNNKSNGERNRNIRSRKRQGKRKWCSNSGYNERSMVENAFFRFKEIFGKKLRARTLKGQSVELKIKCKLLNMMTRLGMPESQLI